MMGHNLLPSRSPRPQTRTSAGLLPKAVLLLLVVFTTTTHVLTAQTVATCSSAVDCQQRTREAIAAGEFERAHDLAWLAYQKAPKQDAATLTLLARAQALSGRGDDAYVMLRRLADAGVAVVDVAQSKDFERVWNHPRWTELRAVFDAIVARSEAGLPPVAEAVPNTPTTTSLRVPIPAATTGALEPASPATPAAPPVTPAAPAVIRAADDLAVPEPVGPPVALAYDSVSARFVLGSVNSDALTVLSQTSTNAASFTSRGWSGGSATTALAIDRAAGDLWVAVRSESGGAIHRLQLISGRRLDIFKPDSSSPAEFAGLAVAAEGLYALDRPGRRIYRRAPGAKTLDIYATLEPAITPLALTRSQNALYVAHSEGLLRIDTASRKRRDISIAKPMTLAGLHSIAWHNGTLLGIQRNGKQLTVVRLRLNGAGTAVTRLDALGAAASEAATLSSGVYYYVASAGDAGGIAVRAIKATP